MSNAQLPAAQTTPEGELLFASARVDLTEEAAGRIRAALSRPIDWILFTRLAMRHGTLALFCRSVQRVDPSAVPSGVLDPLRARCEADAADNCRRAHELVAVLQALRDTGIPAIPYKGPALAQQLYGTLALRGFGDLDVLVPEKDAIKAQAALRRRGYRFTWAVRDEMLSRLVAEGHELQFAIEEQDLRLDLHWRFASRSTCLAGDPERFLNRFEMIRLADAEIPSLPLETYLLVLALHAAKHKWGQLKLICDIAEILRRQNVDWNHAIDEAHRAGLSRVVAVSVLLAHQMLDAPIPAPLARRLKIDRAARAVAAQVHAQFFDEPDENWGQEAHYSYQYVVRERLRDRANIYFHHEVLPRLTPDERDRLLVHLPGWLSAAYYLVRPLRMTWEKIHERPSPSA